MVKFDVETFRDFFLATFQAGMAAKVAEINAEKADSITLEDISADQYLSGWNEKVATYDIFILYGFPEITALQTVGSDTALEITMSVEIVIPEGNTADNSTETKVMRYTRALAEIAAAVATERAEISDLEIAPYSPIQLAAQDGSLLRMAGIEIKGTITV